MKQQNAEKTIADLEEQRATQMISSAVDSVFRQVRQQYRDAVSVTFEPKNEVVCEKREQPAPSAGEH